MVRVRRIPFHVTIGPSCVDLCPLGRVEAGSMAASIGYPSAGTSFLRQPALTRPVTTTSPPGAGCGPELLSTYPKCETPRNPLSASSRGKLRNDCSPIPGPSLTCYVAVRRALFGGVVRPVGCGSEQPGPTDMSLAWALLSRGGYLDEGN